MRRTTDTVQVQTTTLVNGMTVLAGSSEPLAGVTVKWFAGRAKRTTRTGKADELGTGKSGPDGRFQIRVSDSDLAQRFACHSNRSDQVASFVVAYEGSKPITKPIAVTTGPSDITVEISGQGEPDGKSLRALASYLSVQRKLLIRDLIQEFRQPSANSPTNTMGAVTRASALSILGKLASSSGTRTNSKSGAAFDEHFVDVKSLSKGDLKKAASRYLNVQNVLSDRGIFGTFPALTTSNEALYRDYLRGVWVTAAQNMYAEVAGGPVTASAATLEAQLDARFHQDFHVGDNKPQPVAKLLIKLLISVLVAPSNREGFGIAAGAIPAQGTSSDDDYLQALIGITRVSAQELRNRYRVSFDRQPGEQESPIQLNIEALLGLLADTYQSLEEPFAALPAVVQGEPLIFPQFLGKAPFFLEYEEWLAQNDTFYPENVFDIRSALPDLSDAYRNATKLGKGYIIQTTPTTSNALPNNFDDAAKDVGAAATWNETVFPIVDAMKDAVNKIDAQNYPTASDFDHIHDQVNSVQTSFRRNVKQYPPPAKGDRFYWLNMAGVWNNPGDWLVSLSDRAKSKVTNRTELQQFEKFLTPAFMPYTDYETEIWGIVRSHLIFASMLSYFDDVLIPYLRATVSLASGDYATAIKFLSPLSGYRVGIAETTDIAGYNNTGAPYPDPIFYSDQTLPYTTQVSPDYLGLPPFDGKQPPEIAGFEQRFFKLVQGTAMLAWADLLYRNDDPSSIRRARELFKGVIFMHEEDPEISPQFQAKSTAFVPLPFNFTAGNPAKAGQVARARLALYQIQNGMNVYGWRDDMVPIIRYKPLKQAADLFAAAAKAAQSDFLQYMTRYEQAQIEVWQARDLVARSQAMTGIATEQIAIAQVGVDKAQAQVKAVQDQIAAKQKEIADEDSFFSQAKDFFGGMKDSIKSLVPMVEKVAAGDGAASIASGSDILGIIGQGASGGAGGAENAAVATLGSGAGLAVGFGVFAYAGYTSMQSMADAYAKRADDLSSLQNVALPAAQAQLRLKQRDVSIAQYQKQAAQADLDYANQLWRFQQDRFLNAEFWNRLSKLANQLMRGYIDGGARYGWLSERALAFDQNRDIRVIKMNYFPFDLRGVTGPDYLQADLATLEATRLQGVRLTTPVKHTVSLARDFPLAFAELKSSGSCRFQTSEQALQMAYPGTFGYRIRAITIAVHSPNAPAPRGVISNRGVSSVVVDDSGTVQTLVRFPDALALSEFRLHDDLFVYGMPGETLLQFEGSGETTEWELNFEAGANPIGMRGIADVLMTHDANAQYSQLLAMKAIAAPVTTRNKAVALAASVFDPAGLRSLKAPGGASAQMVFDLSQLDLNTSAKSRTVLNLAVICIGTTTKNYTAKLKATESGEQATFTIEKGIGLSNAGKLQGSAAPAALNTIVGVALSQPLQLTINRSGSVQDELSKLFDVVLYMDYVETF
jgi:Tc toxin complex TcA C-terminal TcB-binding domain